MNTKMNTKNNKTTVIAIAGIMAFAATALFLVVEVTTIYIIAYAFTLLGIAAFCLGNIYLLNSSTIYPWFAAFPMMIWRYLIASLMLSAVFVLWENIFDGEPSVRWFLLLHFLLIAFFAVFLLLLKSGKDIIVQRDAEVKEKVASLRFTQADVESLMRQFPEHEKDLRPVADALRYSDPMSHPSLAVYEEGIQSGIMALDTPQESDRSPERCAELLRQIADRNMKVKMMK